LTYNLLAGLLLTSPGEKFGAIAPGVPRAETERGAGHDP
jgi:hypothetical protein